MTIISLLFDVTAGPAGFNLTAALVWFCIGAAAYLAAASILTKTGSR